MSVLVISSHFDDGILSCGQFIAGRNDVTVLTVFSGIPDKNVKTSYDLSCGFKNSQEAMEARRWEDGQATAMLGAEWKHSGLLDSQYGGEVTPEEIAVLLEDYIKSSGFDMVVGPVGLRHPDHIAVGDALVSMDIENLYLYEDLPHRVTHPDLVYDRLLGIGVGTELAFIGDGPIEDKMRALMCYKSQMLRGDLNPYNLYVPERFHKIS